VVWSPPALGQSAQDDFNGDGFADLAVGVPGEDVVVGAVDQANAGAVNVIYGSAAGLADEGGQVWYQGVGGIQDAPEAGDQFGWALAAGDFNGDGFADLAVGAPREDVGGVLDAGAVNIIYGSPTGLSAEGDELWHQGFNGIEDAAEAFDLFGWTLAAGNFGKSARADLAVGVPFEDVLEGAVNFEAAGAVNVIYGSSMGLSGAGDQFWHQSTSGIADAAEAGDEFGFSLVAGNFGKGARADLAVGVPLEDVGGVPDGGAVTVIYGRSAGLSPRGDQSWSQAARGIADTAEEGDSFGRALAAANFGKDARADLAIGVVFEGVGTVAGAGAVNVIYGSANGLSRAGDQFWHQGSRGIADAPEEDDEFGIALTAADFGKGARADLAVGVVFEDVGTVADAGAVNVIYGSANGLSRAGDQFWHQASRGIADAAEAGDEFGFSLAARNFGKGGRADLAVGVPLEDVGTVAAAGGVNVIFGRTTGLSRRGDQFRHQDSDGVEDAAEGNDFFGSGLAPKR
jgi:hypothetical protein